MGLTKEVNRRHSQPDDGRRREIHRNEGEQKTVAVASELNEGLGHVGNQYTAL